ncbi:hypothetical protein [Streptomyces sp. Wh19]|uniref:hypothetical protein n=1 Tax=Streptomyces sp. Wh19 TaxID=3076629 RepID=UPI0029589232|nr:hypothetical protein [Streptomyces sp. Wh19]MDV9194603.1 hypothetical protein [Streptomyces sp. Wh19]
MELIYAELPVVGGLSRQQGRFNGPITVANIGFAGIRFRSWGWPGSNLTSYGGTCGDWPL